MPAVHAATIEVAAPARTALDVPFVGDDPAALAQTDIVFIGAAHGTPYPDRSDDVAYGLATGSAAAPAALRAALNDVCLNLDHYDFDFGGPLLGGSGLRLGDLGDVRTQPADGPGNRARIQAAVAAVLAAGAVPILMGGDDSVPVPYFQAFPAHGGPLHLVQIDAHIDWREAIGGERFGYSSTMRRASEHPAIASLHQIGMRGVGSARPQEVDAALAWGAKIHPVGQCRLAGLDAIADGVPSDGQVLITLDLDALDPGVAPAVNAVAPGGFRFEEVAGLLQRLIAGRRLAGFSIVELVPAVDTNAVSAKVAARLIAQVIGSIARNGQRRRPVATHG